MNLITELFIMDNGQEMVWEKVKEFRYGKMAVSIKDTGEMIKPTDMEDLFILMETAFKVSGWMIKHMGEELMNM